VTKCEANELELLSLMKRFLSDVLYVTLHFHFHVLLGVDNVAFVRLETNCLIHHNRIAALARVRKRLFVPAVAREVLEVQ